MTLKVEAEVHGELPQEVEEMVQEEDQHHRT
jgi:hypothetical protein